MNADLYTVLFLLGIIGAFLAVVVGRLQISQENEFDRDVHDQHEAVKSLEDDYAAQSEVAERIGATMERSDFLSMMGKNASRSANVTPLTAGRLYKQALAIYEAIEHVDDSAETEQMYQRTIEELGLNGSSELQRTDLKTMLRVARVTIHAKAHKDSLDEYKKQLAVFISGGDASLSDGGKLRMREVLSMLRSAEMHEFTDEYRDYISIIENLLLNETVSGRKNS
ncbi:MAG: hypothetical protein SGJ27_04830 [Candidatus Melainabacteria bacterium]|nr:hypothetical protein [Candidatus Melainabacteria bacterium]